MKKPIRTLIVGLLIIITISACSPNFAAADITYRTPAVQQTARQAGSLNESASIGIIGGAVGPTAIYVTFSPWRLLIPSIIIMAIIVVAIICAVIWRKMRGGRSER